MCFGAQFVDSDHITSSRKSDRGRSPLNRLHFFGRNPRIYLDFNPTPKMRRKLQGIRNSIRGAAKKKGTKVGVLSLFADHDAFKSGADFLIAEVDSLFMGP
jgi:hypothetical protein